MANISTTKPIKDAQGTLISVTYNYRELLYLHLPVKYKSSMHLTMFWNGSPRRATAHNFIKSTSKRNADLMSALFFFTTAKIRTRPEVIGALPTVEEAALVRKLGEPYLARYEIYPAAVKSMVTGGVSDNNLTDLDPENSVYVMWNAITGTTSNFIGLSQEVKGEIGIYLTRSTLSALTTDVRDLIYSTIRPLIDLNSLNRIMERSIEVIKSQEER
jgi:hypothetical protein